MSTKPLIFGLLPDGKAEIVGNGMVCQSIGEMLDVLYRTVKGMTEDGTDGFPTLLNVVGMIINPELVPSPGVYEFLMPLPELPKGNEKKCELFRTAGYRMAKDGVLPYLVGFVSEAWSVVAPNKESYEKIVNSKEPVDLSTHPDKQEILILVASTIDGDCMGQSLPILRDKNNMVTFPQTGEQEPTEMDSSLLESLFRGSAEGALETILAGKGVGVPTEFEGFGWVGEGPAAGKVM